MTNTSKTKSLEAIAQANKVIQESKRQREKNCMAKIIAACKEENCAIDPKSQLVAGAPEISCGTLLRGEIIIRVKAL